MIPYYEQLSETERAELTEVIRALFRQTYLLERRYDRHTHRMQVNRLFHACDRHLSFLKEYFSVAGLELLEDLADGILYLSGSDTRIGTKLSEYATKFILMLKLTYDEQMREASSGTQAVTSRARIQEKMAGFRLLVRQPGATEVRNTIRLLKRCQLIEFLDSGDDTDPASRFLIYPTINLILQGDDIRALAEEYAEKEDADGHTL